MKYMIMFVGAAVYIRLLFVLFIAILSPACAPVTEADLPSSMASPTPDASSPTPPIGPDADGDGVSDELDCDDQDPSIYPGAGEQCNGNDDDCNGQIDDLSNPPPPGTPVWYPDHDTDGYGAEQGGVIQCQSPAGYSDNNDDCNDSASSINPGVAEICDGVDQDCDGVSDDEVASAPVWYYDGDTDGHGDSGTSVKACLSPSGYVSFKDDCDDTDPTIYGGAAESCDGIDQDCDGKIDDISSTSPPAGTPVWYPDKDADGYGDSRLSVYACTVPSGYLETSGDCDDVDAAIHPGGEERCNGKDDNCDDQIDEGLVDADLSGIPDCREILVILSAGYQISGSSTSCEGINSVAREVAQISNLITAMGLVPVIEYEDGINGVAYEDMSPYPVVIYDDGGSSGPPAPNTLFSLQKVVQAGQGMFFIGDDLGKQANKSASDLGNKLMYNLLWMGDYYGSGLNGYSAVVTTSSHEVMAGPYGVVQSFAYRADLDWSGPFGGVEQQLMHIYNNTYPAVIAVDTGIQRTVTMLPVVYNSADQCPISDSGGLVQIGVLFQNAVAWLNNG